MCGLVGVVHWDGQSIQADELGSMVGQLRHRGPDELCVAWPAVGVGLGHARLKVIDLSDAARQPMANDDGTIWLVYNGEIYNFQDIRRELEGKGYRFRSRSDTEVALRAYEAWGDACVRQLDGMFALAIWDARRREVLLARDRTGKKPLYFWTDGRCAAFSSEIKALRGHAHVPCEIDEAALPFLLAFGYPPSGQTCYRDIRQVPPASVVRLRAEDRAPSSQPYWDLEIAQAKGSPSDEEASRRVRHLLREAVRRRLIADVPLGAFLSGGVDSTILVGLMAELSPTRPVKTFSIGFEGDARFDETRYAQIVAKRFRTDHVVFTIGPQSFELLERLVWHHDQPFGDASAVPTYLLSQRTREHVTVALAGDGGDEIFAGYDRFLAALWAERIPKGVLGSVNRLLRSVPAGNERSLIARMKRLTSTAHLALPQRYLGWTAYVGDPTWWRQGREPGWGHDPALLETPALKRWERARGWSTLARLLYLNFTEYLPGDLLVKTDRCSMAHGLEVRAPFLDTALMEYVAALPDRCKVRGWQTKHVLRKACRDLLPPTIQRRGKMGFGVPLGTWFRAQWRAPLQDCLGSPHARVARYLPHRRIHGLMMSHLAGTHDAGHQLWLLLTLEVWLRQMERPRTSSHQPVAVTEVLSAPRPGHLTGAWAS